MFSSYFQILTNVCISDFFGHGQDGGQQQQQQQQWWFPLAQPGWSLAGCTAMYSLSFFSPSSLLSSCQLPHVCQARLEDYNYHMPHIWEDSLPDTAAMERVEEGGKRRSEAALTA